MRKLPEGWKKSKLSNTIKFYNGYPFKSNSYNNSGIYNIITIGNVKENKLDLTNVNKIAEIPFDMQDYQKLNIGDILISMTGNVGRVCKVTKNNCLLNQRVGKIIPNIDHEFCFQLLLSNKFLSNMIKNAQGGAQPNLSKKDIESYEFPLPPLCEQKKIAEILSTVDQKIAFIDNKIEEAELLKKGLMQKLLKEGIGHTKFKDSEIGRIPVEWEVKKIEEVCSRIIGGGTPNKNESAYWNNGTILWVTPSEFTKNDSNYISTSENKITEEGLKNSSATLLKPYTVIMSSRATIGECKINTIEMTTNQGFISFECNELLENLYLLYLIKQSKQKIIKVSSGSTFLEVSRTTMKNFKIPLPPLEEQKKIAQILSTTDEKLENLKAKKESFEELKKGLMQKLLTGEVRVKI